MICQPTKFSHTIVLLSVIGSFSLLSLQIEAQPNPIFLVANASKDSSIEFKTALQQISHSSEAFSLEFLKLLSRAVTSFNYDFIVSPFSIWSLLLLQAEGAGGNTYEQLKKVLRLPDDLTYLRMAYKQVRESFNVNTTAVEVQANTALFTDKNRPVDFDYAYKLDNIYNADRVPVDFHNAIDTYDRINQYVNDQTKGKIPKIVNMEDLKEAQMILISAIFFRGQWKSPFNRSFTTEEKFFDEFDNHVGDVNMMFQRGSFAYTAISELDSHVLELPYGTENRLSMIFLMPRKRIHLTSVMERLADFGVSRIIDELEKSSQEYEEDEIEVYVPRFKITADFTLNVILEQMGLTDIFNPNKADLSHISKHSIYLSRIIHKATIEVNEEGTVAAAASGAIFANKATPPRFFANRPFAFWIVDKQTKSMLFGGQVRNPGKVDL